MEISFVTDVMLIIIVVIWTIMITIIQIVNLTTKSDVPLSGIGKFVNFMIHFLCVCAMWLNVLIPGTTMGWVLIIFAGLFLMMWLYISGKQRRYINTKIAILKKEIKDELKKMEKIK